MIKQINLGLFFSLVVTAVFAQAYEEVRFNNNLLMQDGAYTSFEQFQSNTPDSNFTLKRSADEIVFSKRTFNPNSQVDSLVKVSAYQQGKSQFYHTMDQLIPFGLLEAYHLDSTQSTYLGYCYNGRPYIYYNETFNRIVNLGKLCHFTNREEVEFYSVDAFGFPVTRTEVRIIQLYFDIEDPQLNVRELNASNMKETLNHYGLQGDFRKQLKSDRGLMTILQSVNRLMPIYFAND